MTMYGNNRLPEDGRRIVLIKSQATKNRFYALIAPERGIRNADMVDTIPEDLLLGIAYPCLEDGLNDFAVIRTTFETLDLFPEDDPIREEMMEIVNDARTNLVRRLNELHDKIAGNSAHFLGTDCNEFKSYALDMVKRGYPRRNLDSMMKLNVFSSVAQAEGYDSNDLLYHFEFRYLPPDFSDYEPREFIVALFQEVLSSVLDDSNYKNKYYFDRNVFQKFIAVMFVNYATTDPIFYGINKADYAVSSDKDMENTPLYMAISRELREIEHRLISEGALPAAAPRPSFAEPGLMDFSSLSPGPLTADGSRRLTDEEAGLLLPRELIHEEVLLGPLTSLCKAADLLMRKADPDTQRYARVILADASTLVGELKRLGIISPFVNDPGACGT